jgi:hypothetical protein
MTPQTFSSTGGSQAMSEPQLRAYFHQVADCEADRPPLDTQAAYRRGQVRLRWRRVRAAGSSVLAVAVLAGLALGVGPLRPGHHSPALQAPRQFNPLDAYLSFGWLPRGDKLVGGDVIPQTVALFAGHKASDLEVWDMRAIAAGQCRLRAQNLSCPPSVVVTPGGLKLTTTAPRVQGHRAWWAGSYLVWQWAPNAWAMLSPPSEKPSQQDRRDAVKIARNVAYGAPTRPLLFTLQLTGMPRKWHVGSVLWQVAAGRFQVTRFSLLVHPTQNVDGGLEFQTKLPYFTDIQVADPHAQHKICGLPPNQHFLGWPFHLTFSSNPVYQDLCTDSADGLAFHLYVAGSQPPISAENMLTHMRLLGNIPKNWSTEPFRKRTVLSIPPGDVRSHV